MKVRMLFQQLNDFAIDTDDIHGSLTNLMKHVRPQWTGKKLVHKALTGGISNLLQVCYLEDDKSDRVLVRIYGYGTEKFIDRSNEIKSVKKLYDSGLSAPIYCQFSNGLCYGYIHGVTTDENMVRDPKIYKLISRHMAEFHSVIMDSEPEPFLLPKINQLLENIPENLSDEVKNKRYKSEYPPTNTLKQEIDAIKSFLESFNAKIVFSHNDILLGNIIYSKDSDSVHFIDFEYSGPNYQSYDIANHFCEFAVHPVPLCFKKPGIEEYKPELYPDESLQKDWIHMYLEKWHEIQGLDAVKDEDVEALFCQVEDMSMVPNFVWSLWAIIQAANSSIDFDFLGYAIDRMDDYFNRKKKLSERKN